MTPYTKSIGSDGHMEYFVINPLEQTCSQKDVLVLYNKSKRLGGFKSSHTRVAIAYPHQCVQIFTVYSKTSNRLSGGGLQKFHRQFICMLRFQDNLYVPSRESADRYTNRFIQGQWLICLQDALQSRLSEIRIPRHSMCHPA